MRVLEIAMENKKDSFAQEERLASVVCVSKERDRGSERRQLDVLVQIWGHSAWFRKGFSKELTKKRVQIKNRGWGKKEYQQILVP